MEHWKEIQGFAGLYEVSDLGRIRAVTGEIVRQTKGPYKTVSLYRDAVRWTACTHHVVLCAFCGPCPSGKVRHHKNGDTTDNCLVNLEYVSLRKHAVHGLGSLHPKAGACGRRGAKNYGATLTAAKVRAIRRAAAKGMKHGVIAKQFNTSRTNVCMIVNGQRWGHITHGRRDV